MDPWTNLAVSGIIGAAAGGLVVALYVDAQLSGRRLRRRGAAA